MIPLSGMTDEELAAHHAAALSHPARDTAPYREHLIEIESELATREDRPMRQDERPEGTIEAVSLITGRVMIIPPWAVETARALGHIS